PRAVLEKPFPDRVIEVEKVPDGRVAASKRGAGFFCVRFPERDRTHDDGRNRRAARERVDQYRPCGELRTRQDELFPERDLDLDGLNVAGGGVLLAPRPASPKPRNRGLRSGGRNRRAPC